MRKCSIALLPPVFIGLSCSTNCCEKINDLIKNKLPYSQKYLTAVSVMTRLLMGLARKNKHLKLEKARLEDFVGMTEIS